MASAVRSSPEGILTMLAVRTRYSRGAIDETTGEQVAIAFQYGIGRSRDNMRVDQLHIAQNVEMHSARLCEIGPPAPQPDKMSIGCCCLGRPERHLLFSQHAGSAQV